MSVEITPVLQSPKVSKCLKKFSARRSSAASLHLQLLHGCQRLSCGELCSAAMLNTLLPIWVQHY